MNQILILTRNVLAEQIIQQKLQALNYEVYCSTKYFDFYSYQPQMKDLFNHFQYVIISETISESEVKSLVSILNDCSLSIVRKIATNLTEMDKEHLEFEQIHAVISNDDSVDELRECLFSLKLKMEKNNPAYSLTKSEQLTRCRENRLNELNMTSIELRQLADVLHRLSPIELRIVSILVQAGNKIVTREEICRLIWNEKATNSHLASLSSSITRVKKKFSLINLEATAIQTIWGKGYKMNQKLLECILNDQVVNRIVTNVLSLG